MIDYLIIFFSAFIVTVLATPLAKKAAVIAGVMDMPEDRLKVHKKPVPYLGGLAILAGVVVSILLADRIYAFDRMYLFGVLGAVVVITFVGLLDDLFDVRQRYKFFIQIAVAVGLVMTGLRVGIFPSLLIAVPLTIFYIVGACNALNLLDGLDGLASGVTLIASLFFFVLFVERGDVLGIALSLSLMGSCAAFLIYNFNPASIFMGDAGSMLLGIMLSLLMIDYSKNPYDFNAFFISILICGVPIFDTALTFTRRYLNNKPIFPGDRSHFYDQLVDRGFSVKKTVFLSYFLSVLFGLTAVMMRWLSGVQALVLFSVILTVLSTIALKMRMLRIEH